MKIKIDRDISHQEALRIARLLLTSQFPVAKMVGEEILVQVTAEIDTAQGQAVER